MSTSPGVARDVAQEVALSIAPHAAERMVSLAVTLTTRLPHTLAALRAGMLDGYKASKIADVTGCLSDDLVGVADEWLSQRLAGKDPTQLRRAAHYVVDPVDPDGYAQRVARRRITTPTGQHHTTRPQRLHKPLQLRRSSRSAEEQP